MRTASFAILVFVLAFLGCETAMAGSGRSVRAEPTSTEGRLVFDWDVPTAVQTTRSGQRLTLRFTKPPPVADLERIAPGERLRWRGRRLRSN